MGRTWARLASAGQALVEFALILPLILLLVFAVIDFGRVVYAYSTLANASRQANRVAIVDQQVSAIQGEAIISAPLLTLTAGSVDVCYKTADSSERNCDEPAEDDCSASPEIGCLAIVTSTYTFRPITPVIGSLFSSIPLSATSIGPVEYVCPTATKPTCP